MKYFLVYGMYGDGLIDLSRLDAALSNRDDVRIYNRALTAAEVKQLYLMGK